MRLTSLSGVLAWLRRQGCYPSVCRRGPELWRAHVNMAGNYWADDCTPLKAIRAAVALWKEAGKPMDGLAADPVLTGD